MSNHQLIAVLLYVLASLGFAAHARHLSMNAKEGLWKDFTIGAYIGFLLCAGYCFVSAGPHILRGSL